MLLDHFHPPLAGRYGWQGFHMQWAGVIAADLNQRLPPGWRAETELEFGIKIDVGVIEEENGEADQTLEEARDWEPPSPTLTIPFVFTTDRMEIRVYNTSYGPWLMGAIELVSPANKDRPVNREAFVSKCHTITNEGAGVMIVDLVTKRHANLHDEFLASHGQEISNSHGKLYAASYAPIGNEAKDTIQSLRVWYEELSLGQPLPTLPLQLRVGPTMPIDLDSTYRQACQELRIEIPSATDSKTNRTS